MNPLCGLPRAREASATIRDPSSSERGDGAGTIFAEVVPRSPPAVGEASHWNWRDQLFQLWVARPLILVASRLPQVPKAVIVQGLVEAPFKFGDGAKPVVEGRI